MGQYKVPQNVEAEDKILGPLTFRQFVYAMIGFGWAVICFGLFRTVPALLAIIGAPPTMLFLLLAFYTRDGQNFEQILLAMLGFFAANRRRLWLKEDVVETFHIEPRKIVAERTQRNPVEVRSELEKLATLIDSRGWNQPPQPESNLVLPASEHEERIVTPPPTPKAPDEPKTDMLDLQHSPLAQNLATLLQEAAEDVREEAMDQMNQKPARRPAAAAATPTPVSTSGVTANPTNDILKLATQSDELTVSQLAAQATRIAPAPAQAMQEGQTVDIRTNAS